MWNIYPPYHMLVHAPNVLHKAYMYLRTPIGVNEKYYFLSPFAIAKIPPPSPAVQTTGNTSNISDNPSAPTPKLSTNG